MPVETNDVAMEFVKNLPQILEATGAVVTALGAVIGAFGAMLSAYLTHKGNKIGREAVAKTEAGNAAIADVHQLVQSLPAPTTVSVNVVPAEPEQPSAAGGDAANADPRPTTSTPA